MIYFVQPVEGGAIKIGTTIRLSIRKIQLEAEHKVKLNVLGVQDGGRETETVIHDLFAALRLAGEWFSPTPELLSYIEAKTHSWDGTDEVVPLKTVKVTQEAVEKATMAAVATGLALSDYCTSALIECATRDMTRWAKEYVQKQNSAEAV